MSDKKDAPRKGVNAKPQPSTPAAKVAHLSDNVARNNKKKD